MYACVHIPRLYLNSHPPPPDGLVLDCDRQDQEPNTDGISEIIF